MVEAASRRIAGLRPLTVVNANAFGQEESTMEITVNGKEHVVSTDRTTPLLWVLRNELEMTGTRQGTWYRLFHGH